MKFSSILVSGLIFGGAVAAGSAISLASNGQTDHHTDPSEDRPAAVFDTSELAVFSDQSAAVDISSTPVGDVFGEKPTLYRTAESNGFTAYVARHQQYGICVILVEPDQAVAMTCGDADNAAAGQLMLRSQYDDDSPAVFAGITPNDVEAVTVNGVPVEVGANGFVSVSAPDASVVGYSSPDGRSTSRIFDLTTEPSEVISLGE